MIAYDTSLEEFYQDVNLNRIVKKVEEKMGQRVSPPEEKAFKNSLREIANALRNVNLPLDISVAIEYKIPLTNRRIDFILAGSDEYGKDHLIICELKQWDKVKHTDMEDVVLVGTEEHVHPSWQAYSYGTTLSNFNEFVYNNEVDINCCTFLHEYKRAYADELFNPIYSSGIDKARPFIEDEYEKLAEFVSRYIKCKSKKDLLYEIENGNIRPSKMLADSLADMLQGNNYYELIDQQRVVMSNLLDAVKSITLNRKKVVQPKHVFIIRGGAGTGKSIIAIQLLGELVKRRYNAFYVAKSSYVKENYLKQLTKDIPDYKHLRNLFMGSGNFIDKPRNIFDVLIVDEAHRLTEKTKRGHLFFGENQIKEIINAAQISIFFIDETQNIDIKDFGTIENIVKSAKEQGADVHMDDKYILKSQFRCNGSDEYISWLESVLYNKPFESSRVEVDYDIQIFDDLCEMKKAIVEKNNNSKQPSRMLSGDVFEWKSMNDKYAIDINIGDFHAQWNKTKAFATDPKSIDEVGCIHTSQGMEFEYVGLIVGDDLYFDDGLIKTNCMKHPEHAGEFKRPYQRSIKSEDLDIIDIIIRNTYKVLFTRGQRGTYLYVMDPELKLFLQNKIDELKRYTIIGAKKV